MRVSWKRQLTRSRNQGRTDGRARIPAKDQPQVSPPAEKQLAARYEQEIREIAAGWLRDDRGLKNAYCQLLERQKIVQRLLLTHAEFTEKLRVAHARNLERVESELLSQNKPANVLGGVGEVVYSVAIGLLMTVFLLAAAQSLASNQSASLAGYLFAILVAGAVLVGGHYLGALLNVRNPDLVQRLIGVIGALMSVVAIGGLAYLSDQPGNILWTGILGLLVISMLSYLTNTPEAVQTRMTAKPLARAERRLQGIQREVNRIHDRLQEIVATRELTHGTTMVRVRQKVGEFKELVNAYRTGNLEAWPDRGIPEAFRTEPALVLSDVLQRPDWRCDAPE